MRVLSLENTLDPTENNLSLLAAAAYTEKTHLE